MIRCVCATCQTAVELTDNYAGTRIACKNCKTIMRVPDASTAPVEVGASASSAAPSPAKAAAPGVRAPAAPANPGMAPVRPVGGSAPGTASKPPPLLQPPAAAPPKPAAGSAPGTTQKPLPLAAKPAGGSGQGTAKKPPPAPAPAPKPAGGSGPGTAKKPAPLAPGEAGPGTQEPPTLVLVEAVRFHCSHCSHTLTVWLDQVGATKDCPACKGKVKVPAPVNKPDHGSPKLAHPGTSSKVPKSAAPPQAPAPAGKAIRFPCPHCKATIQAEPTHAGLMMVCPRCKVETAIPETA